MEKSVGILYICTGKYAAFYEGFKNSIHNFLPSMKKRLYVFTDSLDIKNDDDAVVIHQEKLGWPYDTLMRYHMFLKIEEQLKIHDYLFFFNANMVVLDKIEESEVIPEEDTDGLVAVLHSSFVNSRGTFETRNESTACLKENEGQYYYQGCLNGGETESFLEMCKVLKTNIDTDLSKNIIAVWHDESHMNWYLDKKRVKKLHPGFSYPEALNLPYEKRILMFEKGIRGGAHWWRT